MNDRKLMQRLLESNGSGSNAQVLRGRKKQSAKPLKMDMAEKDKKKKSKAKESLSERKPFHLIETNDGIKAKEGPRVTCVLITSGLGNRNQMNYYSVEAIQKGASLFEGKPCFLDHMAESESTERPERSVKEKCGYFKNVRAEAIDGTVGLIGELHFDLSESGQMAYQKALTAIHYKGEFPDSNQEYVGLSINANGLREKRMVETEGETLEVNYVTEFTDVGSIDEVTTPARGGRFLATLVESAAGALMKRKDTQTMIVKKLKAALTALTEASKDTKLSDELKTKLSEAEKPLNSLLKEAMKAAEESEEESEEECMGGKESEEESEEESDDQEQPKPDVGSGVKAGHTVTKTVKVKHEKNDGGDAEDDEDDDQQESKRGYIKSLLKEAKIDKKILTVDGLMVMSLKEAKAEISKMKGIMSVMEESIKERDYVPVENGGDSFQESERDRADMNGSFAGLAD